MPKGNPQNITKLNTKRTPEERKAAAAKAGKASGEARRNYASFKACFREQMTDEMMEKIFNKLMRMFLNKGDLHAFDRIVSILDEEGSSTAKNITITFSSPEMEEYGD